MGLFKKKPNTIFGKMIKNVAEVTKAVTLSPINSSYKSITGSDIKGLGADSYTTTAGKIVGGSIGKTSDITHNVLKGVANGATGGLASQATNSIRPIDKKEGSGASLVSLNNKLSAEGQRAQNAMIQEETSYLQATTFNQTFQPYSVGYSSEVLPQKKSNGFFFDFLDRILNVK
jgi:hypothetical protein